MPTRTEGTHQVTQIEMIVETSFKDFTRAFEVARLLDATAKVGVHGQAAVHGSPS